MSQHSEETQHPVGETGITSIGLLYNFLYFYLFVVESGFFATSCFFCCVAHNSNTIWLSSPVTRPLLTNVI